MAQMDPSTMQIFQAFASLLQQQHKQELDEDERIIKARHKARDVCGYFDGWNVSSFLLKYTTAMKEFRVPEEEMIMSFEILTENYVRPDVVEVKKVCGNTWDAYRRGLQKRFARRDMDGSVIDDISSFEVMDENLEVDERSRLGCSMVEGKAMDTSYGEDLEILGRVALMVDVEENHAQDEDKGKDVMTKGTKDSMIQPLGQEDSRNVEQVLVDDIKVSQPGMDWLQGTRSLLQTNDGKEEITEVGLQGQGSLEIDVEEVAKDSKLAGEGAQGEEVEGIHDFGYWKKKNWLRVGVG
ncbi:hypothetical protein R1sor_007425 [Riccia sorocarpa]|uniref:Uncharacterized protein n=1 Tax=Riccia sorocarpa TaxID=122646 RepID=A0ABD3HT14_9MARC